ncbi:MAG: DNA polymerase/3'-5' exonuclease PolX, partial [Verrucomicrobiales bacterium]
DEIAQLLELKGENPFKIRAYRQGAEIVRSFDGDIIALARDNQLDGIKGIGEALRDKLHELATTGTLGFHQKLRAEFPEGLFELFDVSGLGPKKIKALWETLEVGSIADLRAACEANKIAELPGFGAKTQTKILEALQQRDSFADTFRLGTITSLVDDILDALRDHPAASRVAVCGSFRRAKETVHDLDFLVATKDPAALCRYFTTFPPVTSIIACGDTKASVRLENGLQCDLRAVSNAEFPFALQYFTGSKEHNVAIRQRALKHGWSLNEYGLNPIDGAPPAPEIHDETEIYKALGLRYIAPELRENRGEIEAAETGDLPKLVEIENLRGTFHNHTTASDGGNTLEEMAEAAQELGMQYLGIADHSKSSFQARGLDEERLLAQLESIRSLNTNFVGFKLFAGSEVDIHKDGSLDFDDSILAQLDYCVASVHSVFTLSEDEMTARICRAMENEHVTMLGHLTGRLLLKREGYAVNHSKIIDCAAETRTIIELNCSPMRLDMDWRWWKRARDKGVLCSINPDAHSTAQLHYLHLGVRLARKGWLSRENILNTRSLKDVETFLTTPKAKR